ncbi:MAG: hypothetical protein WDM92_13185 [Caulobacteraceae bacterium]
MGRFSFERKPAPVLDEAPPAAEAAPAPAPKLAPAADAPAARTSGREDLLDLRLRLHGRLIEELDLAKLDKLDEPEMRRQVRKLVGDFARDERLALNGTELDQLGSSIFDEMVGLGPIEPLLQDDTIADILINGPFQVYVERRGELELTPVRSPRQRPPAADHQPHRLHRRPAHRRILAHGRRPPA